MPVIVSSSTTATVTRNNSMKRLPNNAAAQLEALLKLIAEQTGAVDPVVLDLKDDVLCSVWVALLGFLVAACEICVHSPRWITWLMFGIVGMAAVVGIVQQARILAHVRKDSRAHR